MWKCANCGEKFEDPEEEWTSAEYYYGVEDQVHGRTPMCLYKCPFCDSEEIEEIDEDEDDEDEE